MKKTYLLLALLLATLLVGCTTEKAKPVSKQKPTESVNAPVEQTGHLVEDKLVYRNENKTKVEDLYITILEAGQSGAKEVGFYDLNHWYDDGNFEKKSPKLDTIFQVGDENGPVKGALGYGVSTANATIRVRGNTSKLYSQKSYQIKLGSNLGLWNNQKVLNLNKHVGDGTRLRNKLSFDFFQELQNFTSLRTRFVHLHIKDETKGNPDTKFVDYGLFTNIEEPDKRFLYAHGLDPNGNLYKANFFEFGRYPDELKLASDPTYNEADFERILQIKAGNDHHSLLAMLEAVNNENLNINDVISTYFDRDNYLTWLAVNLLIGNMDTQSQNFYLYNPLNSSKFYFMPWDYDEAWGAHELLNLQEVGFDAEWQHGLSNYWGSTLHRRFFKDPKNVKDLSAKIRELKKFFTKERIKNALDDYASVVKPYVSRSPDIDFLTIKVTNYDKMLHDIEKVPTTYEKRYFDNLKKPMPIYLGDPVSVDNHFQFDWDESYDLQGDDLYYDFQISQTMDFSTIYYDKSSLTANTISVPKEALKKGTNYWRVIVRDAKGNTQIAFDRIEGENDHYYNGVKEFHY